MEETKLSKKDKNKRAKDSKKVKFLAKRELEKSFTNEYGWHLNRILPFSDIYEKFNTHHRLKTFIVKGLKCVVPNCDKVGCLLIETVEPKTGNKHVDVYTYSELDDLKLMNVDHIVPKSLGGKNHIDNYQIMCEFHNTEKKSSNSIDYAKLS